MPRGRCRRGRGRGRLGLNGGAERRDADDEAEEGAADEAHEEGPEEVNGQCSGTHGKCGGRRCPAVSPRFMRCQFHSWLKEVRDLCVASEYVPDAALVPAID